MHAVMASRRRDLERLRAWQANTATTPGFLDVGSAAIWDTLLAFQSRSGIAGDIAEIGVLHGKSAVLAALHTRPEERLVLCDLSFAEEVRQLLRSVKAEGVEYLAGSSGHLVGLPAFQQYARRCRWIHIDGDHSGQGISQDLALADQWLADAGVISCDDFMNPAYPQVTAAIFHYLDRHRYELSMFLCGYNKCYLARPKVTHSYLTMIARDFYRELAARGVGDFSVYKTTYPSDMNCFGVGFRFSDRDYYGVDEDPAVVVFAEQAVRDTRAERERLLGELQSVRAEVERLAGAAEQAVRDSRAEREQLLGELQSARADVERLAGDRVRLARELNAKRGEIQAMKGSRFWKLRTRWFAVKRALGRTSE